MNEPISDREKLWDMFLQRWPLEKLASLRLEEYASAKDSDCFTYWMEAQTTPLGSIWGGSAFKFGIFARGNTKDSQDGDGRSYSDKYAWYSKYGDNAEEAFQSVIHEVSRVARAARAGNLREVDEANLGTAFKWKIAFLYQNRDQPCVLPIYKESWLRLAAKSNEKRVSELQKILLGDRGSRNILEYGDEIWSKIQSEVATELTPEQAKSILDSSPHFSPIKTPTKKIAGYQTADGHQLALELTNNTTTIYASPGDWLNSIEDEFDSVVHYDSGKKRHSNFSANAPNLAIGNEIVKLVVPTKSSMETLCETYAGEGASHSLTTESQPRVSIMPPLNQILYGPPGTGKTYHTVNRALKILDPEYLMVQGADRTALKSRFDELCAEGRIAQVTFHQSFSYEDFVEGLRATSEDGQISYEIEDGIFKRMCLLDQAEVEIASTDEVEVLGKTIWKMSLGNTLRDDAIIYDHCIENNEIRLGYGGLIDFSSASSRKAVMEKFEQEGVELKDQDYRVAAVNTFRNQMHIGDLVVVSDGNIKFRAIGEITGEYQCAPDDSLGHYAQTRAVKWHRVWDRSLPFETLLKKKFSQMTLYQLKPKVIKLDKLKELFSGGSGGAKGNTLHSGMEIADGAYQIVSVTDDIVRVRSKKTESTIPLDMDMVRELVQRVQNKEITLSDIKEKRVFEKTSSSLEKFIVNGYPGLLARLVEHLIGSVGESKTAGSSAHIEPPKVLIIDEINRGNIASIFGELITLIESSKRAGNEEALEVLLPYSKDRFSVPKNLYIIGTMNTADRSIALLDTALRRRFEFEAMMPDPSLLDDIVVDGVQIGLLLSALNKRIELLYDRDHLLGHSFFMGLSNESSIANLRAVFERHILPTLEEYFFEDWSRIRQVLGDDLKQNKPQLLVSKYSLSEIESLLGQDVASEVGDGFYTYNLSALDNPETYIGIYHPD